MTNNLKINLIYLLADELYNNLENKYFMKLFHSKDLDSIKETLRFY